MPHHDIGLLSTLVISLVAAFAGGLAVRAAGLPPLIGYLLAGVIVGPFTPGVIANQEVASELAEIGVALLLFNIGMHFSFKDLLGVRKIAIPGAVFQVAATTLIGALMASWILGSTALASIAIGLSLSIASTAVATRILSEKRQIRALAGRVALGWLVAQDMIVILALVILPVFASIEETPTRFLLASLAKTALQVTGFVVVMVFGGRRLIPALLNYVARSGSRELFTLAVVVVALGIAYGSALIFGVSLALGAFFAGVVIGESDMHHHAVGESLSMQQIFTILFFVSIGMLFDPSIIAQKPLEILAFMIVILLGTGVLTFWILIFLRVPLHAAALVGGAFAQIGEFSFVLSALGFKNGFYGAMERDLIVAVAILSIVINPFILSFSLRLAKRAHETAWLSRYFDAQVEKAGLTQEEQDGHTILVGCGRVGGIIAKVFHEEKIPFIAIESDRTLTERLRQNGETVIYGDAAREAVLSAAHPEQAKLLLLTISDSFYARQIVHQARRLNPSLEIIARAFSEEEARQMTRLGVNLAIMGEQETAFGLVYHGLQKLGLEIEKTREIVTLLRKTTYEPLSQSAPSEATAQE